MHPHSIDEHAPLLSEVSLPMNSSTHSISVSSRSPIHSDSSLIHTDSSLIRSDSFPISFPSSNLLRDPSVSFARTDFHLLDMFTSWRQALDEQRREGRGQEQVEIELEHGREINHDSQEREIEIGENRGDQGNEREVAETILMQLKPLFPFVVMLLFMLMVENVAQLLALVGIVQVIWQVQYVLMKVSRHELDKNYAAAGAVVSFLVAFFYILFFALMGLYRIYFFMISSRPSLFEALWFSCVGGCIMRLLAQSAEACIYFMQPLRIKNYIIAVRMFGLFIRSIPQIPIWCSFAYMANFNFDSFNEFFIVFYLWHKLPIIFAAFFNFVRALQSAILSKPFFGSYLTESELHVLEDRNCAICFQDFVNPLKLQCTHIFCEGCISNWLQEQKTCPLCRQTVVSAAFNTKTASPDYPILDVF